MMATLAEPTAKSTNQNPPKKIWGSLITNTKYLSGLLTLEYSLREVGTKYPLVALYTDDFPEEGLRALEARSILSRRVPRLAPSGSNEYQNDPRFQECWTKLSPFGFTEYDRIVLLDSDMLVLKNMDELMDIDLDGPETAGKGHRVLAASHACACNPRKRPHYPKSWVPENCAFTSQHDDPEAAQETGAPASVGVGKINSGLVVLVPSKGAYELIQATLSNEEKTRTYNFPDQELLSDVFSDRWVGLPYVYNALKTMREPGIHDKIWRDDRVKNLHMILSPKPWDVDPGESSEFSFVWWHKKTSERRQDEAARGIKDGF